VDRESPQRFSTSGRRKMVSVISGPSKVALIFLGRCSLFHPISWRRFKVLICTTDLIEVDRTALLTHANTDMVDLVDFQHDHRTLCQGTGRALDRRTGLELMRADMPSAGPARLFDRSF
jgi:hypothetical protein